MSSYTQYRFHFTDQLSLERAIAFLTEAGFPGCEEQENTLLAYVEKNGEQKMEPVIEAFKIAFPGHSVTTETLASQNWNQLWESGFEPVRVGDFAGIRADFHEPMTGVKHELLITPKMSFGTGHHATTYQMIAWMESMDFLGKTVLDYGSGTGVLAILAEQLGAAAVTAIDNDPNCIENAAENIEANHCSRIQLEWNDCISVTQPVDCLLANINLNIIREQLTAMHNALKPGGEILLSGLLLSDEDTMVTALQATGFKEIRQTERNGWIALHAVRI